MTSWSSRASFGPLVGPWREPPVDGDTVVLRLYEECHESVCAYVRSFGVERSAAEDVTQEVFLALVRHVERGGSRSNLKGWVFRVAHNLALKRRARTRQWSRVLLPAAIPRPQIDPSPSVEECLVDDARRHRLGRVLAALPERERQSVLLRAAGLRYREIATVMGLSLGGTAKTVARALAKLQRADEV